MLTVGRRRGKLRTPWRRSERPTGAQDKAAGRKRGRPSRPRCSKIACHCYVVRSQPWPRAASICSTVRRVETLTIMRLPPAQSAFISFARSQYSDNCAEKFPDAGGESHRQSAPESDSGSGAQNVCTARSGSDRTQKSKKAQRRSRHDEDKCAGGR
jgi:hypothetical protein